jgi:large subunit ribosomal protein L4
MPKAEIVNRERQVVGQLDLSERVFGAPFRPALIHQVIVGYQANQRQGNACTKGRSDVQGGGRKPWRQKGTGRARAGTIRSPLWRGGGTVFGPLPRSYRVHLPKKMRREALRSVLSRKLKDGEVLIVDEIQLEQPKTRLVARLLGNLELEGKVLLILDEHRPDVLRAARNIPNLFVTYVEMLNAYDVTAVEHLLLTQAAANKIEERYQS